MTYSTIMVHLDLGFSNENLLQAAASLAQRFGSSVIGIAACQPMQITYTGAVMVGELLEQDRVEIEKETREAEAEFRVAMTSIGSHVEWRSLTGLVSLADYIAQESRAADLIVTGPDRGLTVIGTTRRVNIGDLVMWAGRPVLIVPPGTDEVVLEKAVIGWKDTRETRRAVSDALPMLWKARHVTVLEITAEYDIAAAQGRVADVAHWLERHAITAEHLAVPSRGNDAAQLETVVEDGRVGLLIAGAYGHSRIRELVLGGVTRNTLMHPPCCVLLSH